MIKGELFNCQSFRRRKTMLGELYALSLCLILIGMIIGLPYMLTVF